MTDIHTTAQTISTFILQEFLPDEDPDELTPSTELVAGGILDSLATLKLITYLEEEFGITIEPNEATEEHLNTIASISQLVDSKLAK